MIILIFLFETLINNWYLVILFFTVALLYASVGFGGGSSYLAILALSSIAFTEMRAIALFCNMVVVTGNVFLFYKEKIDISFFLKSIFSSSNCEIFSTSLSFNKLILKSSLLR